MEPEDDTKDEVRRRLKENELYFLKTNQMELRDKATFADDKTQIRYMLPRRS